MTNVSPVNPSVTPKAIRPISGRPSGLPSQLGSPANPARADAVEISSQAIASEPASEAPFRADLVDRIRADIDAGRFDDEITDERFDAILPALLKDLREQ